LFLNEQITILRDFSSKERNKLDCNIQISKPSKFSETVGRCCNTPSGNYLIIPLFVLKHSIDAPDQNQIVDAFKKKSKQLNEASIII